MSTRWKNCNLHELIGADYALRIFARSPHLTKDAREVLVDLINEVRAEINAMPEEYNNLDEGGVKQCGDDCKGECSGEVTGVSFCPHDKDAIRRGIL